MLPSHLPLHCVGAPRQLIIARSIFVQAVLLGCSDARDTAFSTRPLIDVASHPSWTATMSSDQDLTTLLTRDQRSELIILLGQ